MFLTFVQAVPSAQRIVSTLSDKRGMMVYRTAEPHLAKYAEAEVLDSPAISGIFAPVISGIFANSSKYLSVNWSRNPRSILWSRRPGGASNLRLRREMKIAIIPMAQAHMYAAISME